MKTDNRSIRTGFLAGTTAIALVAAAGLLAPSPSYSQSVSDIGNEFSDDARLLLEANTLVYDNDAEIISAIGNVQIDYDGIKMVAERVDYDQRTGRMKATGNVQIIDRQGNKTFADTIDVTDDFAAGFVQSLRVETTDRTYIGADTAERVDDNLTIFNRGVYTACEPCEDNPDKAPIWRIKAVKVIWNEKEKYYRFERASFELFGFPIATLPVFQIPDHTVKRKSGFLFPSIGYTSELGAHLSVPYYLALNPSYDLTITGTGYTLQGFLTEAQWRQRLENGEYSVTIAGINQQRPHRFTRNSVDQLEKKRGLIGSKGRFEINPRWTFGWDILVQSDKNFGRTYGIDGYDQPVHTSEIYLTGLNRRNFFDLRFQKFQVQEAVLDTIPANGNRIGAARDPIEPWVLPSFDYTYTPDRPVAGGELRIDVNARVIHRGDLDATPFTGAPPLYFTPPATSVRGAEGTNGRLTAEAEWKRTFVSQGGLLLTPILHARGDAFYTDYSGRTQSAIVSLATTRGVAADIRSAYYRGMVTAGLEARWPVLFSTTSATHVLEPMAQVFARPDAAYQDTLGIPNEDAQSLVFDAATLFERDKFSSYDRLEGGVRANVGLRYSGSFANGWTAHALFGQSYHLAGDNPYASPDLVGVGAFSGLATSASDFVGMVGVSNGSGFSAAASARFDNDSFDMRRVSVAASNANAYGSSSIQYAFIDDQKVYGFPNDRHEVSGKATINVHEFWKVSAGTTYEIKSGTFTKKSVGFLYDDECFTFGLNVSENISVTRLNGLGNVVPGKKSHSVSFSLAFRTLGDFGSSSNAVQ